MRSFLYVSGAIALAAFAWSAPAQAGQAGEGRFVEGAKYAQASGSYYSRRNQQDRAYRSMQQSTQRAYGTNRR
jgi:hypothetical protein